jgi:STE24 endopeptidase
MMKLLQWIVFVAFLLAPFGVGLQSPAAALSSSESAQSPQLTIRDSVNAAAPHDKITAYHLPPELERKAHNRGRIRFASRLAGSVWGLFLLWLILQRGWAARFRAWAERVSRHRFLQALTVTALVVLTLGVLQLPFEIFDEWVLKLYKISVQPWSSWIADWGKGQFLVIVIGSFLVWLL